MARKRTRDADDGDSNSSRPERNGKDEDSSSDDEDFDVVNVDFEWFNFDPDVDFHGVKTLLRQLFDVDSSLLSLSAITDLCLQQRTIGSTVKVDDKANDAYAFLTVLNLRELRGNEAVAGLVRYLVERARSAADALSLVVALLESQANGGGEARVGLVMADRLVNMPSEIAPPLFSMLIDELEAAVEDGEPYEFSHYLIVSKTYREVQSSLDAGEGGERKSKKAKEAAGDGAVLYFHPEDEVFQRHAAAHGSYAYTKDDENVADSKRAFQDMGIKSFGSLILIEAAKFGPAVQAIGDYLGSTSA